MSDQFGGQQGFGQQGQHDQAGWGSNAPSGAALTGFVQRFRPDADVTVPSQEFLAYAQGNAPAALVELWREHGLGFYGEQRLAIVDPGAWMEVLQTWFGDDVTSFPFAVTSFGHVYHYDQQGGRDRIQCLDPHFQTNTVIGNDLVAFFTQHLLSGESHVADLEGPRGGARHKLGELAEGEIYYFDPILALGGQVSPESLAKGNGPEHLAQIHQRVVVG